MKPDYPQIFTGYMSKLEKTVEAEFMDNDMSGTPVTGQSWKNRVAAPPDFFWKLIKLWPAARHSWASNTLHLDQNMWKPYEFVFELKKSPKETQREPQ